MPPKRGENGVPAPKDYRAAATESDLQECTQKNETPSSRMAVGKCRRCLRHSCPNLRTNGSIRVPKKMSITINSGCGGDTQNTTGKQLNGMTHLQIDTNGPVVKTIQSTCRLRSWPFCTIGGIPSKRSGRHKSANIWAYAHPRATHFLSSPLAGCCLPTGGADNDLIAALPATICVHGRLDSRFHAIPTRHHRQPLEPGHQIRRAQVCVAIHRQADRRVPGDMGITEDNRN